MSAPPGRLLHPITTQPSLTVEKVARDAIAGLGKKHLVIPGRTYRFSNRLMGLLPRKRRMKVLADSTKKMYADRTITVN